MLDSLFDFLKIFDWVLYAVVFVIACKIFEDVWISWRQAVYNKNTMWTLLEIRIPRETLRGPKAMDQVLSSLYNIANSPVGIKEIYWDGEVVRWLSLEIVGENGATRLFVRMPAVLMHPFLSSFYGQYPDIEIMHAEEDYIEKYPRTYQELKKRDYELYGLEITQAKEPAYALDTYVEFESKVGNEKGRIIDPMATVIEMTGKLKPEETLWIQFLIRADVYGVLEKNAANIIKKLKNPPKQERAEEGDSSLRIRFRTKGEEKTLKRAEEKKGKAIFETVLRCVYFAPKAVYNYDLPNRGVFGYVAQFQNDTQRVRKLDRVRTKVEWEGVPWIFPHKRLFWKRVALYDEYQRRFFPEAPLFGKILNSYWFRWCIFHKPMFLSSEELATMFHIPTNVVLTQATMERIESKRITAPSNLPG